MSETEKKPETTTDSGIKNEKINHRTSLALLLGSLQSGEIGSNDGFQPTFQSSSNPFSKNKIVNEDGQKSSNQANFNDANRGSNSSDERNDFGGRGGNFGSNRGRGLNEFSRGQRGSRGNLLASYNQNNFRPDSGSDANSRGRHSDRGRGSNRGRRSDRGQGHNRGRGSDRGQGYDRGRGSDRGQGYDRGRGMQRQNAEHYRGSNQLPRGHGYPPHNMYNRGPPGNQPPPRGGFRGQPSYHDSHQNYRNYEDGYGYQHKLEQMNGNPNFTPLGPANPDVAHRAQYPNPQFGLSDTSYMENSYDNYYSENYIVEYYEVDELGNHYPITDQSFYTGYYPEYYGYNEVAGAYGYGQIGQPGSDGKQTPPNTGESIQPAPPPLPKNSPYKPPLPLKPNFEAQEEPQQKIIPHDPTANNLFNAINFSISEEQFNTLAQTVASLENQTQTPKPEPIGTVIERLMNRGKAEEAAAAELKQESASALGISLEMDSNPEGILDRLETKFSASTPMKSESDETTSGSKLEANLAKAYSHFLQASESRKRTSSFDDENEPEKCPSVKKQTRKTFDVGLGISLDINYDSSLAETPHETSLNSSGFEASQSQNSGRSDSPPGISIARPLSPFNLMDRQSSPTISPKHEEYSPFKIRRQKFTPPRFESSDRRSASPLQMDDDDIDRRSSSPEAPPVMIEDDDDAKNSLDFTGNSRYSPSPPRMNDSFDNPPISSRSSLSSFKLNDTGSFNSSFSGGGRRGGQSSFQRRKPMYCRTKIPSMSKAPMVCDERFFVQYPDYFEHQKAIHGLRNGIPCIEQKCHYTAPGLDQFLNHIKARHGQESNSTEANAM